MGFQTRDVDGHCGWCEYGEGEEMVAVLCHLDVVPAGDGWHYPPYDCTWAGGRIYGRGVIDDKGPAAAALYALKAVRDSGAPLHRRVRLLVGCNEEKGSSCIRHYVEAGGEIPVMGFTPDGMYPIINGEKGIAVVDFRRALAPSPRSIRCISGGTAHNVVPDRARAELNWPEEERSAACALTLDGPRLHPGEGGQRHRPPAAGPEGAGAGWGLGPGCRLPGGCPGRGDPGRGAGHCHV